MPSPFPGMDPFLEDNQLWPVFHHNLVLCLYQVLLPGLVDRYRARVQPRRYLSEPGSQEHLEEFIEIRRRDDQRVVTFLDVVSPANKSTPEGRRAYLDHRQAGRAAGTMVEIDVLLQGEPTLEYSREGLPYWNYAVTVTRPIQPERFEIYTATLQKRLPRFRLPLSSDDRDTVVDLNVAFNRCYDQGGFAAKINYRREPAAPLSDENRRWLDDLLRSQNLRPPLPPPEKIAQAAYYLWLKEGCPSGRDKEHWQKAIQELTAPSP